MMVAWFSSSSSSLSCSAGSSSSWVPSKLFVRPIVPSIDMRLAARPPGPLIVLELELFLSGCWFDSGEERMNVDGTDPR